MLSNISKETSKEAAVEDLQCFEGGACAVKKIPITIPVKPKLDIWSDEEEEYDCPTCEVCNKTLSVFMKNESIGHHNSCHSTLIDQELAVLRTANETLKREREDQKKRHEDEMKDEKKRHEDEMKQLRNRVSELEKYYSTNRK